ncbi:hypothetical protein A2U01_0090651, partial [Trifolium medium]|nr:hypothetical protein [Trifolium medium]
SQGLCSSRPSSRSLYLLHPRCSSGYGWCDGRRKPPAPPPVQIGWTLSFDVLTDGI